MGNKFIDLDALGHFKEKSDAIYGGTLSVDLSGGADKPSIKLTAADGSSELGSAEIDLTGFAKSSDVEATYAKKEDLASVYRYAGSVANYAALPDGTEGHERNVGDVYNVEAEDTENGIPAGGNVVWDGSKWDVLGPLLKVQAATSEEVAALFAVA